MVSHRNALIFGLAAACCCLAGTARADSNDSRPAFHVPLELQPYQVAISLAADPSCPRSEEVARHLRETLPHVVERTIGPRWTVEWRTPTDPVEATEKTSDDVSRYVITVSCRANVVQASVQVHEPLWTWSSPVVTLETADARDLGGRLVPVMARLFRPKAAWEPVGEESVRLRVQAAALASPDPELPLLMPNEVFAPGLVFRNRDRSVQRVNTIPWTLLLLENPEDGRGVARVVSGLRNALAAKPRGRIDLIAVAVRSVWEATELQLRAQSTPVRPLVAHNVLIHENGNEETPPATFISDRYGCIRVPAAEPIWVWAAVKSGDLTLAEVPFVPGSAPALVLELPNDQLRLRVEGQLRLLQGELVGVVAERTALLLSGRSAASRGAWTDVDRVIAQLNELPTADQFRERVSGIRVPAVAACRAAQDSLAERRIQRSCDETQELIRRHLVDDKVRLFLEEVAELRAAAADAP